MFGHVLGCHIEGVVYAVDGSQGCCQTSCSAWDSQPHVTKNYLAQTVNSVELRNSLLDFRAAAMFTYAGGALHIVGCSRHSHTVYNYDMMKVNKYANLSPGRQAPEFSALPLAPNRGWHGKQALNNC